MANLFTHHDPFHTHKILGALVLLHFIYRFGLVCSRGYGFVTVDTASNMREVWFDAACMILHGLLSWSSLLLPLPQKRNFNSPMIWPEFRLHSILFASRSVVASVVGILGLWPTNTALNYAVKLGLVYLVGYLANVITEWCGEFERRTTNSMPYPKTVTAEMQKEIKKNYAMAQFTATLTIISEDPTMAWSNLLAIQGAPLLMTLVRKGKITALWYHKMYIYQLAVPMYILLGSYAFHHRAETAAKAYAMLILHCVLVTLRFAGWSKYLVWALGVFLLMLSDRNPIREKLVELHSNPTGIAVVVLTYVAYTAWRSRAYEPILSAKEEDSTGSKTADSSFLDVFSFFKFQLSQKTIKRV